MFPTALTGLTYAAVPEPSLALLTAKGSRPALDVEILAEEGAEPKPAWRHEMDGLASGQPRVDVLDSHASVSNTPAEVLVHPSPLEQADLTELCSVDDKQANERRPI